jgi:hypothetical protein
MTFSISLPNINSTSYQLTGDVGTQSNFNILLNRLFDNQEYQINPPDIRDSILSIWSSAIFKPTIANGTNIPYIGIDTINPNNRDIKDRKILIGKKEYQGIDTINNDILNSDLDILLFNTKNDSIEQNKTKIGLLSGINNNFLNVPFIESEYLNENFKLSFINNSNINILSSNIRINNFKLPQSSSASNNKTIFWNNNEQSMIFDNVIATFSSIIGTSSQPLDIYGDPVNINGFDLNFTDSRRSPIQIGDIEYGNNFNNISIFDMLNRIIYKYLPPITSIRILSPYQSGYTEFGLIPNIILEFSIFKRTLNTNTASLSNMIPGTYPAIVDNEYSFITSTASGFISSTLNTSGVTFSITVSDGNQVSSSSTNIRGIYPYFYGFLNSDLNNSNLSSLFKLVESKSDKTIPIQSGSGFFYFIYDSLYGELSQILDDDDNVLPFEQSLVNLSSPDGLWSSKQFLVYKLDISVELNTFYKYKY